MHHESSQPASVDAPFEQLDELAYIEVDCFCGKCAYNLRGQPVRREPRTGLALAKCPECGSFQPAGQLATVLRPWLQRGATLVLMLWLLVCVWLMAMSLTGQVAVTGAAVDELGRIERRWRYYDEWSGYGPNYGRRPRNVIVESDSNVFQYSPSRQLRNAQRPYDYDLLQLPRQWWLLLWSALGGLLALGLVSLVIWTLIFPHWRKLWYVFIALLGPLAAMLIVTGVALFGGFRWLPTGFEWVVVGCMTAGIAGGMLGVLIGRPTARGVVRVFLPPRLRGPFAYLWIADGRTPPLGK